MKRNATYQYLRTTLQKINQASVRSDQFDPFTLKATVSQTRWIELEQAIRKSGERVEVDEIEWWDALCSTLSFIKVKPPSGSRKVARMNLSIRGNKGKKIIRIRAVFQLQKIPLRSWLTFIIIVVVIVITAPLLCIYPFTQLREAWRGWSVYCSLHFSSLVAWHLVRRFGSYGERLVRLLLKGSQIYNKQMSCQLLLAWKNRSLRVKPYFTDAQV